MRRCSGEHTPPRTHPGTARTLALIPLASILPAIVSLALLTAVLAVLTGYETWRYYESRDAIRHADHAPGEHA